MSCTAASSSRCIFFGTALTEASFCLYQNSQFWLLRCAFCWQTSRIVAFGGSNPIVSHQVSQFPQDFFTSTSFPRTREPTAPQSPWRRPWRRLRPLSRQRASHPPRVKSKQRCWRKEVRNWIHQDLLSTNDLTTAGLAYMVYSYIYTSWR